MVSDMIIDLEGNSVEFIDGISKISERYDAFLLDIWGVLHDSVNAYPGAVDCLEKLKRNGKRTILLSNAARRSYVLEKEFLAFGITPKMYDQIVSSGELTWSTFASDEENHLKQLGRNYYLIGSEKYGLTDGLNLKQAKCISDADFVLAIGVIGNPSNTDAEEDILQSASEKKLPMVCANPDQKVVRGGVMGIAVGAVAARYEELGGEVVYFGKPHEAVYTRCLDLLEDVSKNRIVAVGDALKTDIAGANANMLDSIIVGSGIHAEEIKQIPEDTADLAAICNKENQYPKMVVKGFYW